MVPGFVDVGGPWRVLPPGIHDATVVEIEERFATNTARKRLFDGLFRALSALRSAGCKLVYLDGSFVSGKPTPGDFDACWESIGVDVKKLDPVFLNFTNKRQAQKQKYYGELFVASGLATANCVFLDFFQVDKYTGKAKGIIRIVL